jgi:hypothetical protein
LERKEVKAKRTEKDHAGHNSGGTKRETTISTTSLDDESNQSYNSNNRKFG